MKVLLVDDDRDTTDALADLISMMGHTVSKAYSGAQSLATAATQTFDLVLLDLSLPDIGGHDVCLRMRESEKHAHTHIVALTGHTNVDAMVDVSCFNLRVLKPIDFGVLESLLSDVTRLETGLS